MRLAIFLFVCFAASTAVNSTQTNYSGANNQVEKLRAIPNDIPRLPSNNSSLTRQLRQVGQPDWCKELKDQSTEEVMTNCKELHSVTGYVLRIGKSVTEKTWKKFSGTLIAINGTNVEVIDSSLTEVVMTVKTLNLGKMTISNNPKLKSIVIKAKDGAELEMYLSNFEIKGNSALKSIKMEAESFMGTSLAITENGQLETIEFAVPGMQAGFGNGQPSWAISKNRKLSRIQMNCESLWVYGPLQIVGNRALTELNFPGTMTDLTVYNLLINDNVLLKSIKIPETTESFEIQKLEIQQNFKLKMIDVGDQTRWKDTELIVRKNSLLPSSVLETLNKIEWKTKDIPNVRGGTTTVIKTDKELIGSSETEVNWIVDFTGYKKIIIKNNPKLERIVISGKKGQNMLMTLLEIKENPVLKSIKIEAEDFVADGLIIIENNELETIEYNVLKSASDSRETWIISNNLKLRRIQLQNCREISLTNQPLQIIGNKALTELQFPETMERIELSTGLHINDNDNLETIKIPATTVKLWLLKLEIRQNDKLKTIDVGEQTRWKLTNVVVRENPLLSSATLETLKGIQWRSKDIQGDEAPPVNPAPVNPSPPNPATRNPPPRNPINPGGNRDRDRNGPYVPAPVDSGGLGTSVIVALVIVGLMILACIGCCVCCCIGCCVC